MKRLLFIILLLPCLSIIAQESYYFNADTEFNSEIKSPEKFLGYKIGDHHSRYDKMVEYMKYLSESSERVSFEYFGQSVERRPQIILTISSPSNLANLEDIRKQHLQLSDPENVVQVDKSIPVIVQLGFNIHGNEASGGEASLLAAYYLAAAQGPEIDNTLENSVIFIEPVLNPDGRGRFVTWANMNRNDHASPDGNDREHNEAWPGGRTNHYWFDLNRDWLPLVQQESVHRMIRFHKWRPNVITDHHEMGTNSTFFFEPTKPGSENQLVPVENYNKLNTLFAKEYSKVLDKAGHYYDSGRSFDNSYPGYGSSYADINGGLAILFEQASTRGLIQTTDLGYDMHFSLGIKNQLLCALSTVRTSVDNKEMLNDYMFRFYKDALKEAGTDKNKAYVFGDKNDHGRTREFVKLLRRHSIDVYELSSEISKEGESFTSGSAFVVPTRQAQYKMVKTMFEANNTFPDSLFYDATAWALIYSYGLPFAGLDKMPAVGQKNEIANPEARKFTKSNYGYIFEWSEYYSASTLAKLHDAGVLVRGAWDHVTINTEGELRTFGRGSIFIPVQYQEMDGDMLYSTIGKIASQNSIDIYTIESSMTASGPWAGNGSFRSLENPKVLLVTGDGVSSSSAGTLWHMLDIRVGINLTKTDISRFSRINLHDYNTLILPSGTYSALPESVSNNIAAWVRKGGKILSVGSSMNYLKSIKLISFETKRADIEDKRIDFNISRLESGKHSIGGVFVSADLDITNPLGFGYSTRKITVYKNNRSFVKMISGTTSNVVVYNTDPVISGYVSKENLDLFEGSASLLQFRAGRGSVTVFVDDPVFRGCWYGTDKLVMNAIFF
jgi:hypothetical protein